MLLTKDSTEFFVKVSENPTICQPISFTTNCPSVLTWDTPSIIENKVTITTPGSYSYKATCIIDGISVNKTVNFNVTQKPFKIDNVPTTTIEQGEKITFSANCNSGCKDGNIVWKSPDGQIIGTGVGNSSITCNPTSVGSITYTAECTVDGIKQSDSKTISVKAGIQIPPANPCDFSVTFDKQVYGVGDFIEFIIYPSGNYTVYTNGDSENPTPEVTCSNTGTYVRCKSAQPLSELSILKKSIFPFDYNAQYKIVNNAIGVGSCTQLFSQYVLANKKSIVNINLNDFKPKTNTKPTQGKKNCDSYGQGSPNSCLGMPYNAPDGKLNWIEDTGNFGVFGIYNNEAGSFGRNLGRTPESIGLVDKSCSSANGRVTWYTDYNQPSIGSKSILNIYEVTKVPTPITKTVYLGRCVYNDGSYCHTTLTFDPSVTTQKVCSPSKSLREENTEENLKTIASEEAAPCLPVKVIEAAKFILTDVLCNKLKSIKGDEELKLTTLSAILAEQGIQLSAITPSIIQDLKDGKCSSVVEQLTSGITGSSTIENINEILKDSDGILNDVLDEIDRNKPTLTATTITPASCGLNNGAVKLSATGGTPPYQYSKDGTTFQSLDTFEALAVGKYTFYVKDSKGEKGSLTVFVKNEDNNVERSTYEPIIGIANARIDGTPIIIRWDATTTPYTFTPKAGVTLTRIDNGKVQLTTTNPEDKKWEGIYGVYFKKNDHNSFIGFYNETMSGICTPSGYTLNCNPMCKERWLPEEVYNSELCNKPIENYPYNNSTFDLIEKIAPLINFYSTMYGVSPVAVAGAIADEYNTRTIFKGPVDWFQDEIFVNFHPNFLINFETYLSINSKLLNATRNDIGIGNINVATAKSLYESNKDLLPPNWNYTNIVDYIRSDEGTVHLACLVMKRAKLYLEEYVNGYPQDMIEAVYITYYKQGDKYYEKFLKALTTDPNKKIRPGEGCRVLLQRDKILGKLYK